MDANSVGRPGGGHYPAKRKPFHPDFPVGHPQADFYFRPGLHGARGFDQTSARAGVGKITPDWNRKFVDAKFDRYETLDSRVLPAVASPVGAEQIGFERR